MKKGRNVSANSDDLGQHLQTAKTNMSQTFSFLLFIHFLHVKYPVFLLTLYHTITTFNNLEKEVL